MPASETFESPEPGVRRDSELQFATPTPWDSVRHDAYTVRFAMDHLARHRPRVLYLALGETDDWAHDGRYDRVLETYTRTDRLPEAAVGHGCSRSRSIAAAPAC